MLEKHELVKIVGPWGFSKIMKNKLKKDFPEIEAERIDKIVDEELNLFIHGRHNPAVRLDVVFEAYYRNIKQKLANKN